MSRERLNSVLAELEAAITRQLQQDAVDLAQYRETWMSMQQERLYHCSLPIREQAQIEFGFQVNNLNEQCNIDAGDDYDFLVVRAKRAQLLKRKLILSQIDYYNLLLEYKEAVEDLMMTCQKPVDDLVVEYYKSLVHGLTMKLKSMQLHGREEFEMDGKDLMQVKINLQKECAEKRHQLNQILSRRLEYERLATRYGELKRAVEGKRQQRTL